ncbi:hypothetical protein E1193_02535 [Micromonospora sp. KC606]|uniref:Tc toxin subunit A-related protein n=1 Tax=Micromonospora sp. KC606 TaxID=2530379 RepID=UPI001051EC6E|nr:hemopexin repeat-containing protein [Micromonospora sp. KC606]TDC85530.1 hypothetical protein E1193_02535 [Micromonospora sp. KC606]
MPRDRLLPSYQRLFGELDLRPADESRSAHSPAAYLVELLRMLEDDIAGADLLDRRPDLRRLLLDGPNTVTEVPYLDIVTGILEELAGEQPYETLRAARFPLEAPFHLADVRLRRYLGRFAVAPADLYRAFTGTPEPDVVAREFLGLTGTDVDFVTTSRPGEEDLRAFYGLGANEPLDALAEVARFRRATGLSAAELRELLCRRLEPGDARAAALFVHGGDDPVRVGKDGLLTASAPWYDRVHRFVRLARRTGTSLSDLDLVLRACAGNRLDTAAVRTLAVVLHLRARLDLPIDVVCALAAPMDTLGWTGGPESPDLFGRVFAPPSPGLPVIAPAADAGGLSCAGDILAPENREFRRRVAQALAVPETDLVRTVERLRDQHARAGRPSPFDLGRVELDVLSLLHRVARLTSALTITVDELFDVLAALDRDPSLRRHTTFGILLDTGPAEVDCHRLLEAPDPGSGLWLAQTLAAVVAWLRESGLTAADLHPESDDAERARVLATLRERLDTVAFRAQDLESARFGPRAAQALHEALAADLTTEADPRLLLPDATIADETAFDAINDLVVVEAADFLGLGLGDRVAEKIYTSLVYAGCLTPDGRPRPGAQADAPRLGGGFGHLAPDVFARIAGLLPPGDDRPPMVYPADLGGLPAEVYDNLIFLGHLGADGTVRSPEYFANPANAASFVVDAGLDALIPDVLAILDARAAAFRNTPLRPGADTFAALPLSPAQIEDVLATLRFNGYLAADGSHRDRDALEALPADGLAVAVDLLPYRREILAALRAEIATARDRACAVSADDFLEPADAFVAARVMDALTGEVLDAGVVRPELLPLFGATAPVGLPGLSGLGEAERAPVLSRLAEIVARQRPYRLDPAALRALGLNEERAESALEALADAGWLEPSLTVPPDRVGFLATAGNALGFTVPGLGDYTRDVFGLLHPIARELTAGAAEVRAAVSARAGRQSQELRAVLQDACGLTGPVLAAICRAVGGSAEPWPVLLRPDLPGGAPDPRAALAYRRIMGFARLAGRLNLSAAEVEVAFHDQDLAGRFPEALALPTGVNRIDALLESADGAVYVFTGPDFWRYDAATLTLPEPLPSPLADLSPAFARLTRVIAAFARPDGTEWIIGHEADETERTFRRGPGNDRWTAVAHTWGAIRNAFTDTTGVDGGFTDELGRVHLFRNGQHVRYSGADHSVVDEGYPRAAADWWPGREPLPEPFRDGVRAAFPGLDGRLHLFAGDRTLAVGDSADRPVAHAWGHIGATIDKEVGAVWTDGTTVFLSADDRVVGLRDGLDSDDVRVADGFPTRLSALLPALPAGFADGLRAAFTDRRGVLHLFTGDQTVSLTGEAAPVPTAQRWGRAAPALADGRVDAVLSGLDGHTYLFSGGRYLRYSGTDLVTADLGYPRLINRDWGGLAMVRASFVLDARTYLFGQGGNLFSMPLAWLPALESGRLSPLLRRRFAEHGIGFAADAPIERVTAGWRLTDDSGSRYTIWRSEEELVVAASGDSAFYVRYSTSDYGTPDAGFPRPLRDEWWNLPDALGGGLADVDAVFTGRDGRTYLFSGDRLVTFDARRRWWSAPAPLREAWDSLPFDRVDAAFLAADGATYVFSGDRYVRYSTADYTRVDDGYPAVVAARWGRVDNAIARTGRVDAALVTDSHTYLFSGGQYVRYEGLHHDTIEDGYPRPLSALREEPGLEHLPVTLSKVDGAVADRAAVRLFEGSRVHVVATEMYQRFPGYEGVGCAFTEDGALLAWRDGGWWHLSPVEAPAPVALPARPRMLRELPARWTGGLDAVLPTHLFAGPECYDVRLGRAYPIAETWGLPKDALGREGRVDAGCTGPDGRTYLFSGDRFSTFTAAGAVDGEPRPIADHFPGLTEVAAAYTHDGVTHLLGPSGTPHLAWTAASLVPVAAAPWDAPAGFEEPAAVLAEGDDLVLLAGERFVRRAGQSGPWSLPQPIGVLWRGYGRDLTGGQSLRTAFAAADGGVWFVFGDRCSRYVHGAFTTPQPVSRAWGRPGFERVDAAFTDQGVTYVFSGDRYARYSGADYRDTDPGYPRPSAGNLRAEEPFRNLPEKFEEILAAHRIDAVTGDARTIRIFAGGECHTVARELYTVRDVQPLGRVRHELAERGRVDAALVSGRHTYLFAGDQYTRFTGGDYARADDGYPRTIAGGLAADLGVAALPAPFTDRVDAALYEPDGVLHLFHGAATLRADAGEAVVRPLAEVWGRVRSTFGRPGTSIDAALQAADGALYVFRGTQFVRYSGTDLTWADPGYPRTVRDDWGDLPVLFEPGIDGAFTFGGATYLLRDAEYVRYTDPRHRRIDRTFPQRIAHRFADVADYRIADVHTIARFAALSRQGGNRLAALLGAEPAVEEPYQDLADLYGWPVHDVAWAKRQTGLLPSPSREEERLDLEFVLRIADLIALARRFGTGPARLHAQVWLPAWAQDDPGRAADALHVLLAEQRGPEEFAAVSAALHRELTELRRDALRGHVLAASPEASPSALFDRLLIDVDMGGQGSTSRIREAIAAAQMYVHRWLLDLEPADGPPVDEGTRQEIRRRWQWLRAYRTWEANRKVFLYPENYLRPELRDTKTPAFRQLEDDLLQSGMTAAAAAGAYRRYLDEYTEVSRLAIAGGYVRPGDGGVADLVLFGRTRTSPRRFYHRTATFHDNTRLVGTWTPWRAVQVQIGAEKVYPVTAFGRTFVFWATVEALNVQEPGKAVVIAKRTGESQSVDAPPSYQRVTVFFSFLNLNQEWVAAQVLTVGAPCEDTLGEVGLTVRPGPHNGHDAIVVTWSATSSSGTTYGGVHALTPEHYTVELDVAPDAPPPARDVATVLAEDVDPAGVVWFGAPVSSADGAWFSVDHKGGSFLCRPAARGAATPLIDLSGNSDRLPEWRRIDAAVEMPDGTRLFFDSTEGVFTSLRTRARRAPASRPIADRWGRCAQGTDAVLVRGSRYIVFAGEHYLRCVRGAEIAPDRGYPRALAGNLDHLPEWPVADAFTGPSGAEYYFDKAGTGWADSSDVTRLWRFDAPFDKQMVDRRDLKMFLSRVASGRLGDGAAALLRQLAAAGLPRPVPAEIPPPPVDLAAGWTGVDAAWRADDKLYLARGRAYVRYTLVDGSAGKFIDPGYPRSLPRPFKAVFQRHDSWYAFGEDGYTVLAGPGDPESPTGWTGVAGRWGDLPDGLTGALDAADELFLFAGDRYVRHPKAVACPRPYLVSDTPHEIIRLTTGTASKLNQRLLSGGVAALLDTLTQETDELPAFSTEAAGPTTVHVRADTVDRTRLPSGDHLDFQSANGLYYWEIFFHAPLLIAQALNAAQRFEEARTWYEYIFDPTRTGRFWRFLPFLATDPAALAVELRAVAGPEPDQTVAGALRRLEVLGPLFRGVEEPTAAHEQALRWLADVPVRPGPVGELLSVARELHRQVDWVGSQQALLATYLDDPFDPHAIAELRPVAYRRAVVAGYIDNLLDWGDQLFRQYTAESIDEARMLYTLAHGLLGPRPEAVGMRPLPQAAPYRPQPPEPEVDGEVAALTAGGAMLRGAGAVHAGIADPYFFVPANTALVDYWDLVEDRLRKIRRSLDILGMARPLPLFEPPIDPAALVRAAASGDGLATIAAATEVAVPHHRFPVVLRRAQELTDRVRQLGQDLAAAFDRRDAEELTLLQNRQEAEILALTLGARQDQVKAAEAGLLSTVAARDAATARVAYYQKLIDDGPSGVQRAQLDLMSRAAASHLSASVLRIGASIAHGTPQALVGPFIVGTEFGGKQVGDALEDAAGVAESVGEGLSMLGEALGVRAEQENTRRDWELQLATARADLAQLSPQVTAAELAVAVARRELDLAARQIQHQTDVAAFLRDRFTGLQLHQWTASRLGDLYFEAYALAEETARSAERAYRFERGAESSIIQGGHWDGRRAGLLAAESLARDLDRLAAAYLSGHHRGLEITKRVSLRDLDPLALLRLRAVGACDIALTEQWYDRDFPGHYRRQIRTISVAFTGPQGELATPTAVLTQTGHRTVLEAETKAVRHLLDPQGAPPATLRADWRADQRIALSDAADGTENNGLFELRYDDERYLPFEGTGAVSTWRLELTGPRPAGTPDDVVLTVRYTAEDGGRIFADAVRALLPPQPASRYVDVAADFPEAWEMFRTGDGPLRLPLTPADLPGIVGRQVTGLGAAVVRTGADGTARFLLNGDRALPLADGRLLATPGLTLPSDGSGLLLTMDGDRSTVSGLILIVAYRAAR